MVKFGRFVWIICLWGCLAAPPVLACRYNVRDIAFTELTVNSYYLFAYTNKDTPEEFGGGFKELSTKNFFNSNIKAEVVNVDEQPDHPALKYIDSLQIDSFPKIILISSDDRAKVVGDNPSMESIGSVTESIVFSPMRYKIIENCIETYGVVFLIEGKNAEQNEEAREMAEGAVEAITGRMSSLPKAVSKPPVMLVLPQNSAGAETHLLWSLGIESTKEASVAVLHGRARIIGPVLKGAEISEKKITYILSAIGADCECGLDRKWMQGRSIPLVWDKEIQTRVAKNLGFDPESPMVKMEMSRIIGRGTTSGSDIFQNLESFVGTNSGYREIEVVFEAPETTDPPQEPQQKLLEPVLPEASESKTLDEETEDTDSSPYSQTVIALIALAAIIVAIGGAIALKGKTKKT